MQHFQCKCMYGNKSLSLRKPLNTGRLHTMKGLDNPPTRDELSKAIVISPEVIKLARKTLPLFKPLYDLLLQCWTEGVTPQEMWGATIITLYRNKGDRSNCNNYRGYPFLVLSVRFCPSSPGSTVCVYPEVQCRFKSSRVDVIFSLRQLEEKCREQRQP